MGGLCLGSLGYSRVASRPASSAPGVRAARGGIGVIGLLVLVGMPLVGERLLELGGPGHSRASSLRGARGRRLPAPAHAPDGRHAAGALALDRDDAARACPGSGSSTPATPPGRSSAACWPASTCSACYDITDGHARGRRVERRRGAAAFLVASISACHPQRIQAASRRPDVAGGTARRRGRARPGPGPARRAADHLSGDRALGVHRARGRSRLDAPALAALRRHAPTRSRSSSPAFLLGLGIGSSVGVGARAQPRAPGAALGWCQAGVCAAVAWAGIMISTLAAVLADRSVHLHESVVQLPAGLGALPLGGAAGRHPLGRELPAGAGGGGRARRRPGTAWSAGCSPPTPLGAIIGVAGRRRRWSPGSAASTRSSS